MKKSITKKSLHYEMIKFAIIGIFITVASIVMMYLLYNVFKMGYWGSSAVSYCIASILSFLLNKTITFQNTDTLLKTTPKFFVNIAICYAVAYLAAKPVMKNLLSYIHIEKINIIEQAAMLLGVCLFTVLNFIGQKYFVFNKEF